MSLPVNLCRPCRAETMGTSLTVRQGRAEPYVSRFEDVMQWLCAAQTFTHMCTVRVNVCVLDIRVLQCHSPMGPKPQLHIPTHSHAAQVIHQRTALG